MNEPLFYPYYGFLGREPEFEIGYTVMTRGLRDVLDKDRRFIVEIDDSFERYIHKDLGVLGEDDGDGYVYEVIDGEEVMGMYLTSKGYISICTSYDRRTTLLFLSEER